MLSVEVEADLILQFLGRILVLGYLFHVCNRENLSAKLAHYGAHAHVAVFR